MDCVAGEGERGIGSVSVVRMGGGMKERGWRKKVRRGRGRMERERGERGKGIHCCTCIASAALRSQVFPARVSEALITQAGKAEARSLNGPASQFYSYNLTQNTVQPGA